MKTFIILGVLLLLYTLLTLPKDRDRKNQKREKQSPTTSANVNKSIAHVEVSHGASADTHEPVPHCPICGSQMRIKTARKGAFAGKTFWSCSQFPRCRGLIDRPDL